MTKQFYSIEDISKYLDVSIPYIRKLVRAKLIPYYRFGNRLKFKITEIDEWIENRKVEQRKNAWIFRLNAGLWSNI